MTKNELENKINELELELSKLKSGIIASRQVENKLKESESALLNAEKLAKMGSWEQSFNDQSAIWSENCYIMYGYKPFEFEPTFEHFKNRVHPDDWHIFENHIESVINNKEITNSEVRVILPDGTVNWFQNNVEAIFQNEKLVKLKGIHFDITERKITIEALKKSEDKYRVLYESNQMPISIFDTETLNFLSVNNSFVEKYGYTREEFLNMTILDIRPESEINKLKESVKVIDEGVVNAGVFIHKKKNGEIIQVEILRHDLVFDGKKAKLVFVNDVTDKIKVENDLLESEEKYRSLVETAQELVWKCDINSCFTYLNPAWEKTHGYKIEEMLGKSFGDFQRPEILERDIKEFSRHLEGGFVKEYETCHIAKDGKEITLLFNAIPLYNLQGSIVGTQGTAIDITERKQAWDEIKNMKDSLELLNNRLEEIRENERTLIAGEIHDRLGQALTVLKIDTNWLIEKTTIESEERIKLKGMSELLTGICKDVQRISAELRPPMLDEIGLVAALEWYMEEFEKRTSFKCHLKLNDIKFPDEKKGLVLYRILQEALTNVIRHADAKNVSINLYQADDSVIMEAIDDGIGISKEKINSYKSLGLIGIRERVKKCNGTLDISSGLKKGTKLRVSIPLN